MVRSRDRGPGVSARDARGGMRHVPIRYLVALGLIVSILSVAWGFTGIEGELRLRDQGLAFNDADLTLDAASASRSHLGEALRIAAFGDSLSPGDVLRVEEVALSLAEEEFQELEVRIETIMTRVEDDALAAASGGYLAASSALMAALHDGELGAADALFATELDPLHSALSKSLAGLRAESLAAFTGSSGTSYVLSLVTRFLLAVAVPIAAIALILDATRRRQRQRDLELELRAERDISRTKDEFIANVSHELRTPLTIVQASPPSSRRRMASLPTLRMRPHSSRGSPTSSPGWSTTSSPPLAPTPVRSQFVSSPSRFARPSMQSWPVSIGQGPPIDIDIESAYVYADAFRLRQVVRNLMSNARKHGGEQISVIGAVDRDHYVLVIADDGPGVDPEIEDRIFERFVHGAEGRLLAGSVGLGLAIVKSLVHRMNGTITYDRVGKETRFTLRIPLSLVGYEYRASDAMRGRSVDSR